jgi:hypothetical protein
MESWAASANDAAAGDDNYGGARSQYKVQPSTLSTN